MEEAGQTGRGRPPRAPASDVAASEEPVPLAAFWLPALVAAAGIAAVILLYLAR